MALIVPDMLALLTLGSTFGSLCSSLSLFWPARRHCVLSTHITQPKVHLHLWWNRKVVSFKFCWTLTETCCPLLGIQLRFLPPGFITTLQMLSSFLSVRTLSLSGLSNHGSLMSNLAALELNPSNKYISWSQGTITSGPKSWCTCWIHTITLQWVMCCLKVPSWGVSNFAYSLLEFTSSSTWSSCLISQSDHFCL